jgi:hypothetical protein
MLRGIEVRKSLNLNSAQRDDEARTIERGLKGVCRKAHSTSSEKGNPPSTAFDTVSEYSYIC